VASDHPIERAGVDEAAAFGRLISRLLAELYPDYPKFTDAGAEARIIAAAARLLRDEPRYFAFVAYDEQGAPAGAMALNECAATYAFGLFGEISELYVDPAHRSAGLGGRLIDHAKEFARGRGWSMLEVGAPDAPRWQKSIDFYIRCGFEEIGPRLFLPLG
jgi:GNAT superfamily N-acetyltransferase